jgi:hypothetical protein
LGWVGLGWAGWTGLDWTRLLELKYVGFPESKFRWAIEKKIISKSFILPFDVHTLH